MHGVEDLGLLKMDFLGLRNLDVISDTLELIEATRGIDLDIDDVPLDDEPTPTSCCGRATPSACSSSRAARCGRSCARWPPPASRTSPPSSPSTGPGPMAANMHNDYADRKNGRKPVEYLHPDAEEVLGDTYGLMIYQESVMRVAQKFAGYSLAEADNLRKACGKKNRELMAKEREKFVDGLRGHRLRRPTSAPSCSTSSSRSPTTPSTSALLRLRLRRLPDRLPQGALPGRVPRRAAHQREGQPGQGRRLPDRVPHDGHRGAGARRQPVGVGLRAGARGGADGAEQPSILFGLSAVRNVGEGLVGLLVAEREANGPFADFYDFCERVDFQVLNKRTLESLIKAGGFDSLGHPRQGLLGSSSRSSTAPWPAAASATWA